MEITKIVAETFVKLAFIVSGMILALHDSIGFASFCFICSFLTRLDLKNSVIACFADDKDLTFSNKTEL